MTETTWSVPLLSAIKGGHAAVVDLLLERGAQRELVGKLLALGCDPNQPPLTANGYYTHGEAEYVGTLLAIAISREDMNTAAQLVRYMLDAGADPTMRSNGKTPLELTARWRMDSVIPLLLESGHSLEALGWWQAVAAMAQRLYDLDRAVDVLDELLVTEILLSDVPQEWCASIWQELLACDVWSSSHHHSNALAMAEELAARGITADLSTQLDSCLEERKPLILAAATPERHWSPKLHRHFPARFRAAVRPLVLAAAAPERRWHERGFQWRCLPSGVLHRMMLAAAPLSEWVEATGAN